MQAIRIKGLRSLVDTGLVDIKPINILVGTNSSGKSTFLRSFPLLRQSVEKKTRGPILWSGTYTDFESFSTSSHHNYGEVETKSIEFTFKFAFQQRIYRYTRDVEKDDIPLVATISVAEGRLNSCFTNKYSICIDNHELIFNFDDDGLITDISSTRLSWQLKKNELKYQRTNTDSLLPIIKHPDFGYYFGEDKEKITATLFNQIKGLIKLYSGSSSESKIRSITSELVSSITTDQNKLNLLRNRSSTKKWDETLNSWTVNSTEFLFLAGLADLFALIENSAEINRQISNCFRNVRYIAPLRASPERYHRYQDLSVDELDHRGENIAMFLSNIPKKWRKVFDSWMVSNFGYIVKEKISTGHVSIELEHKDAKDSDNLADMGFGYSQILPIVVQLWSVASGYELSMKGPLTAQQPIIFAIEQPELHLHPMMQAKLSEIFSDSVALAKSNNIDLKLIIETHSQSIISRLGDLVSLDKESKNNINILLFNRDIYTRKTTVEYSHFDEDGRLKDWPIGFFAS